jgi:hypothetical protein
MQTFKKLPNTSPNRKNAVARKYTLPAISKVFRTCSRFYVTRREIIRKAQKGTSVL